MSIQGSLWARLRRGTPPNLSCRGFLEDASSILLLLHVSPAAKRVKEEKVILGGHPPDPPAGAAPFATPPQKRHQKTYTCEHPRTPGHGTASPGPPCPSGRACGGPKRGEGHP